MNNKFGISINNNSTVVIFNTMFPFETLHTVTIPGNVDPLSVAITPKCNRAVITVFSGKELVQIDPNTGTIEDMIQTPTTFPEDIDITPDGLFAVSTDGSSNANIISYSLQTNAIVTSLLPPDRNGLQAVAISPNGNGLVLAAQFVHNRIRIYNIDPTGILTDTGKDVIVGKGTETGPLNITFTPNGNFAFVVGNNDRIVVLNTKDPNNIFVVASELLVNGNTAQTVVVSQYGNIVYVLSDSVVYIYCFDPHHPCNRYLTLMYFFAHNLSITLYFGVNQMALDPTGGYLFISGSTEADTGVLEVFTICGTNIGPVPGIQPESGGFPGAGVAVCRI